MTPTAWRIFRIVIALILLTVVPTSVVLERALSASLLEQIEQDLVARARMAAVAGQGLDAPSLDALADELGQATDARYTFIDATGTVLADTEFDEPELSLLDNHAGRPEVRAAEGRPFGTATRYSTTLEADLLYVALARSAPDQGFVRVSMPTTAVRSATRRMRATLATTAAMALILGVLGSWLAARVVDGILDAVLAEAQSLSALDESEAGPEDEDEPEELDDEPSERELTATRDPSRPAIEQVENELSRAVRSLAEQRDLVRAVVDGIADGVVAIDSEGRVQLANAAAVQLLDWKKVPRGKRFSKRVPSALAAHVEDVRELGSADAELQLDLRTVQVATAELSQTSGMVLVLRDVTELRRLERVRRDFVANVSHELGTPIAVIRANAETLLLGALDDPEGRVKFTEAIDRQANRLSALVSDLLQISRIESGELPLHLEEVSLADVFAQVVEVTAPEAERRATTVLFEPTEARVVADRRALDSILENLVGNAIKYGSGKVTLEGLTKSGLTRIYVRDNGPGIPEEHRERVFERFYRVDKGRSRDVGGTGLGLSIVRNLAHAMGGRVGVDAQKQGGAAFWVEL